MASPDRIPTLDGWRAVAIGAVLFSHGFLLADASTRRARAISYTAGYLGGLGVAIFFAISGYLITTLLLREHTESGRICLRGFYLRRAFRILPPAYVYLGFLFLLGRPLAKGEFASAAFFYSNYWADRTWWTQHFWSLSMEEHFYLLWPAALVLLGISGALRAAGVAICAILLWRPWSLTHLELPFPALQRTDMRLDAFLFAGVLAIALHSGGRQGGARRVTRALTTVLTSGWFRLTGWMALAAVSAWSLAGSAPAIGTLLQSALLPPLLVSAVLWPGSVIYRFLEWAPLRWIGRISYGLYLWQQLFLVGHSEPTLAAAAVAFLPRLAAIFAAATVSYYLMERRLLHYGRSLSTRFTHTPAAPPLAFAKRTSSIM